MVATRSAAPCASVGTVVPAVLLPGRVEAGDATAVVDDACICCDILKVREASQSLQTSRGAEVSSLTLSDAESRGTGQGARKCDHEIYGLRAGYMRLPCVRARGVILGLGEDILFEIAGRCPDEASKARGRWAVQRGSQASRFGRF